MNYSDLAKVIIKNVGTKENILSLTHCATRLRFNLKDDSKANTDVLKGTKGVMGVVNKGGQYQVIIGSDVANVYKEIIEIANIDSSASNNEEDNRNAVVKVLERGMNHVVCTYEASKNSRFSKRHTEIPLFPNFALFSSIFGKCRTEACPKRAQVIFLFLRWTDAPNLQ